jgi:hypothetical protein
MVVLRSSFAIRRRNGRMAASLATSVTSEPGSHTRVLCMVMMEQYASIPDMRV